MHLEHLNPFRIIRYKFPFAGNLKNEKRVLQWLIDQKSKNVPYCFLLFTNPFNTLSLSIQCQSKLKDNKWKYISYNFKIHSNKTLS